MYHDWRESEAHRKMPGDSHQEKYLKNQNDPANSENLNCVQMPFCELCSKASRNQSTVLFTFAVVPLAGA